MSVIKPADPKLREAEQRLWGATAAETPATVRPSPAPAVPRAVYRLDQLKAHQRYKAADGTVLPGVTTVLGLLDKPALIKWAWRCGRDGIDIDRARDGAAGIGTVCHARIEAWLRGMDFDASNIADDVMAASAIGLGRFLEWWEGNGLKWEALEIQMVSEDLRVGGTADIVAVRPNGRRLLIDVKTSSGVYREARLQVATYAAMYEEEMAPAVIDEAWIVRVGKDEADDIETVEVRQRAQHVEVFRHLAGAWWALKGLRG